MSTERFASGPVMVWELAGRPRRASLRAEPVGAVCAMCGQHVAESVHVKHSIGGKSFTDQYLLARTDSDRTCYGCAWVCTGKGYESLRSWTIVARTDMPAPQVPRREISVKSWAERYVAATDAQWPLLSAALGIDPEGPEGVSFWVQANDEDALDAVLATGTLEGIDLRTEEPTQPMPMAAEGEHLLLTSRADMRHVVATLADPPDGEWLVSVAESGQKHTVPYSTVNYGVGQWRVRMDARDITATPTEFRHVLGHVLPLRAAGFTPTEIEHLTPPIGRLNADTLPVWQHHATALTPWRTSALIHLVTFLPNKEHLDEYCTRYAAPGPGSGDADRVRDDVPERDPRLRGRGEDRPETVVGPGPDRAGDGHGDGLLF